MVEGSQVDWAAHANDPIAIITEFLAFDEAVGKVMDFAKQNGETAVVVLSDHGNSGFTIGSSRCPGYDKLSIDKLFSAVTKYKLSANGLESILVNTKPANIKSEFKKYTDIDLTDEEVKHCYRRKTTKKVIIPKLARVKTWFDISWTFSCPEHVSGLRPEDTRVKKYFFRVIIRRETF
jgi:alkaline phosphatase